jgi:phenylpropionate dioxygenase-like ring-hydroxylating dioxygenase large terminal subunit
VSVLSDSKIVTSLPQHYYVSDEQFNEDVEKIWRRQWLYAGHVSQVASAGDHFTFTFLNESLVIVRTKDHDIRAYHNVCGHRGMRLCEGEGHARRLVCPYHSWSYSLEGELLAVSQQQEGVTIDRRKLALSQVQVSVWQGLIFVNFSPDPLAEVHDLVGPAGTEAMARLEPERMKIIHRHVYPTMANWKLLLENGVECYHCPTVHDEFCKVLDPSAMTGYYADDYNNNLVQELVIPLQYGKDSLTLTGEVASKKLLGEFGRGKAIPPDYSGTGFMTQPGYTWGDFHPDHAMIATCFPTGPTSSEFAAYWLVHEDAVEGVDYDLADVIGLWATTHPQDARTLERQQAGIRSSAYKPGPFNSNAEPAITGALDLYMQMLRQP